MQQSDKKISKSQAIWLAMDPETRQMLAEKITVLQKKAETNTRIRKMLENWGAPPAPGNDPNHLP